MKKNMGSIDRVVRFVLALVFAGLIFTGTVTGVWAIILGVLAVIFVATSFISFCPLYLPLKLSTLKK